MPLDRPDRVLLTLERSHMACRVVAMAGVLGCIGAAVYIAFAWAISPCEADIAALQVDCTWPAGAMMLERLVMHLAAVVTCCVGAGMLLRAAR